MTKECRNFKKLVAIYNTDLNEYEAVQAMYESDIRPYFIELASDIRSPYYNKLKNYTVVSLGDFKRDGSIVSNKPDTLGLLSDYADPKRIEYQRIVQVLNYLPEGYFKMPSEMQAEVQKQIQEAVISYVNKYADVDKLAKFYKKDDDIILPEFLEKEKELANEK